MNLTGTHKGITAAVGILLLAAIALAAWFHQPLWLAAPVAVAFILFSLQQPAALFYILLFSIPWSIEYNFTPSLGTDLPDEPLMLLLAFSAVIMIIYHRNRIRPAHFHFLLVLLILQFCWTIVTVLLSSHVLLSLKFVLAKSWYLLAFVAAPILLVKDEKMIRKGAFILAFSMLSFMVLTLFRHSQYNFTFDKANTALEPFYRNHVNYSALLVFIVPVLFAAVKLEKFRWNRNFLYLVILVTIVALYFSYARGAWLSLLTGLGGYWLLKKRLLFLGYVAGILITLAAIFYLKTNDKYLAYSHDYRTTIFHTNFKEHLVATYQMKDVSTAERYYRWIAGIRMWRDSWMTGTGPNTFYYHYKSYAVPAFKTWVSVNEEKSTVHNYFLMMMIEQGLFGLLFFVVLTGAMFWYAQKIYYQAKDRFWKVTAAALSILLVMLCTINFLSDLIESDKVGSIFYLVLALLVIGDFKTRSDSSPDVKGISQPVSQ